MAGHQIGFIALSFAILIAITGAAQFGWLPSGTMKAPLVFACGVAMIVALRLAAIPPGWFAGETEGFGLAVFLLLWGWVSSGNADERTFGRPLLYGAGLTVLVLNVVAFVRDRI